MTRMGNIKALVVKSTRLKVKDVLKTQHSAKWIEAINIEVNSLINNFKCLIPEEIDYEKDYDCIHATIDLKVKYLDEITIDKHKARKRYARKHLRVSRQRKDFVKSVALRLVKSNDLIAYLALSTSVRLLIRTNHTRTLYL